jgi:hypothetical protein
MVHAILRQPRDPRIAAIPVFAVFIAIEAAADRRERGRPPAGAWRPLVDAQVGGMPRVVPPAAG